MKNLYFLLIVSLILISACQEKSKWEKAGEEIEEAAKKTGEAVEESAEKAGKEAEKTERKLKDWIKK